MKRTFELSSELFECIDVNMYESILSEQNALDAEAPETHGFQYPVLYNWEQCVLDGAKDWIQQQVLPVMKKYGVAEIDVEKIYHPREYNFRGDILYFSVTMNDDFMETMKKHIGTFRKVPDYNGFLRRRYGSCDGFTSFMPQSLNEIERFEDEERCLGAYLTIAFLSEWNEFILSGLDRLHELFEESQDWIFRSAMENWQFKIGINDVLDDIFPEGGEELSQLYERDCQLNDLYHSVADRIGHQWRQYKRGEIVCSNFGEAVIENDAMAFLYWAAEKKYTVKDLYTLAS